MFNIDEWLIKSKIFYRIFFILFFLNFDGHFVKHQKQSVSILLKKWAEWALNHHNQKYVSDFNVV